VLITLLVLVCLFDNGTKEEWKMLQFFSLFIPFIGIILPMFGVIWGKKSIDSKRPKMAMIVIVLNVIVIGLSFAFGLFF
jgi:hypothetical protein